MVNAVLGGENLPDISATDSSTSHDIPVDLTANRKPGLEEIRTPYGNFPFISSLAPETVEVGLSEPIDTISEPVETFDIDVEGQILYESRCSQCHELRSPDNQALSAEEWRTTVIRMVAKDNADISMEEAERIIAFVQAEAQRLAAIMAKQLQRAQQIVVSGGVSGRISEPGDVDYYKFDVREGQTLGPWWVIQPFDNYNETGLMSYIRRSSKSILKRNTPAKAGERLDGINRPVSETPCSQMYRRMMSSVMH